MSDASFSFEIVAHDANSRARVGCLKTPHGVIETPNFFFCATKGTIKGLSPKQLHEAGVATLLGNTYHLMLQPGAQVIEDAGGLHCFMDWSKPLMTDSGGFQIFAMGHGSIAHEIKRQRHRSWPHSLLQITEEGAVFRSYIDGRKVLLSPESSMTIQRSLGADLIMPLDECTPFHADRDYTERSMAMSLRWGDRCLTEFTHHNDGNQALYGIVQGGVYPDLRRHSACYSAMHPFFGTAIGGTLGGSKSQMYEVVANTVLHGHPDRPLHLLGVGDIDDILMMVREGIDTFDCVTPTRLARHGWALHRRAQRYRINLRNTKHRTNHDPIDHLCSCYTCQRFTCSYLNHLFKAKEMLGYHLVTLHNVVVMVDLMRDIRAAITEQRFVERRDAWLID